VTVNCYCYFVRSIKWIMNRCYIYIFTVCKGQNNYIRLFSDAYTIDTVHTGPIRVRSSFMFGPNKECSSQCQMWG